MTPIIEVLLSEKGEISYRLRVSPLDTRQYGQVFATLIRQLAAMFRSEAGFPTELAELEVVVAMMDELKKPTAEVETRMMQ